ncbi:MAG: hypothetical protein MZU95_09630 [Desulfomicrobium escambiense]|nr:hypothetical protein [Desulfomicrobium escambiense]
MPAFLAMYKASPFDMPAFSRMPEKWSPFRMTTIFLVGRDWIVRFLPLGQPLLHQAGACGSRCRPGAGGTARGQDGTAPGEQPWKSR